MLWPNMQTLQGVLLKNPSVLTDALCHNKPTVVKRQEKGPEHASTLYLDVGSSEVNYHLDQNYLQSHGVTLSHIVLSTGTTVD